MQSAKNFIIQERDVRACSGVQTSVDTFSKYPNSWDHISYILYSHNQVDDSTTLVGKSSRSSSGTQTDKWCLDAGYYIAYLGTHASADSNAFSAKVCGQAILTADSFVMFSLDKEGKCTIVLSENSVTNTKNAANIVEESEFVTAFSGSSTYSDSGDFSGSSPASGSMSMDFSFSMSMSYDFSMSDYSSADFSSAGFSSADFSSAGFSSADFSSADFSSSMPPPETAVPTVVPTMVPTFIPTMVPTAVPTRVPTRVPTSTPTRVPTAIGDTFLINSHSKQCYADCTYPGMTIAPANWSIVEYCSFYISTGTSTSDVEKYKNVPQCLSECSDVFCDSFSSLTYACPAPHGVYAEKLSVNTKCLDAYAASFSTRTEMTFTTALSFAGVSADDLRNDQAAQNASILTLSSSMNGVPANQITIEDIVDVTVRKLSQRLRMDVRSLMGLIHVSATEAQIKFKIIAILEQLGFSSDQVDAAFNALTVQISDSLTSGQFQSNLIFYGDQLGSTTTNAITVANTVTFTDPVVTVLNPTMAPTDSNSGKGNDGEDALSGGAIAGIVIACVVVSCAIAALAYYYIRGQNQKGLENEFRTHSFFPRFSGRASGNDQESRSLDPTNNSTDL